jgi:hypothetical protein
MQPPYKSPIECVVREWAMYVAGVRNRLYRYVIALCITVLATTSLPAEKPVSSESIADSVGINVHLHYTDTPYSNFPLIESLLRELHVRHIRDGLVDTTWGEFYKRHNALGALGIGCVYVTSPKQSDTLLAAYPQRVRRDFEGYEAPNEYNNSGDSHWPETLQNFLPRLQRIANNTIGIAGRTLLIGPSLTQPDAFAKAAGLEHYFDYANLHNYFAGRNPGTPGWGGGGYGSIAWNLDLAKRAWGAKPVMTTEIGYNTDASNKQGVPEDVQAKYMPRLILEQLMHGIRRTYIYELIDVGPKVSKNDAAFGLVRNDGSRKPAFNAVKNLIQITTDHDGTADLSDLSFGLSGDTKDVHHLLARRSDGTYLLFFWVEEPAFDPDKKSKQDAATRNVTFSSSAHFRSAELLTFSGQGEISNHQLGNSMPIRLQATDSISVLRLRAD